MLKFGVLSCGEIHLNLDGNDFQNLGDWIQTIAVEELYKEWGIKDYIHVNKDHVAEYDGDYVLLPYNGFNTCNPMRFLRINAFPLSDRVIPVFFSMHFHDDFFSEKFRLQLIQYGPVGCRDEETMINMRRHGIQAYLSGCVTALFSRRVLDEKKQNKVLLVEAPNGIEEYMPSDLRNKIEYLTHIYPISRTEGAPIMNEEEKEKAYQEARRLLNYYKENAALVITHRLHVAAPCVAMGIPVILARSDEFDGRYAWIDKFLPMYPKGTWNTINWYPDVVDYEEEKKVIKNVLKNQLMQAYDKYKDIVSLSEFYENRKRHKYNQNVVKALEQLDLHNYHSYAIWGAISESMILKHIISRKYPHLKLVAIYDKNIEGLFEGYQIQKPDMIKNDNTLYFVMPRSAFESAKQILESFHNHYVLAEYRNDEWENNL